MADVTFQCPGCKGTLRFQEEAADTTQSCPGCGQRVIVPRTTTAVVATTPGATGAYRSEYEASSQAFAQQERSRAARASRKVKPGIGCFAMIAVMFAVGFIGWGFGMIADVAPRQLQGWTTLMAGIGGVIAFGLFGYYLTDTDEEQRDQGRR